MAAPGADSGSRGQGDSTVLRHGRAGLGRLAGHGPSRSGAHHCPQLLSRPRSRRPAVPLWRLAALSGMHRSELLGLRWQAVDFDAGRLSIVGRRVRVGHDMVDGVGTKTTAGRRRIDIHHATMHVLRAWRTRQTQARLAWVRDGLTTAWSSPAKMAWAHTPTACRTGSQLVEEAGVPPLHFYGTLLLRGGVPVKVVQERLAQLPGDHPVGVSALAARHASRGGCARRFPCRRLTRARLLGSKRGTVAQLLPDTRNSCHIEASKRTQIRNDGQSTHVLSPQSGPLRPRRRRQ
jgi:hypothetical protein